MKQTMIRFIILLTFACALVGSASAQSAFTYQGRLMDGTNVANAMYEMEFSLYDALTGGNLVGTPVSVAPVAVQTASFDVAQPTLHVCDCAFDVSHKFPGVKA